MNNQYPESIFSIKNETEFLELALTHFRFQYEANEIYGKFCRLMKVKPEQINSLEKIPFLPIELFKSNKIVSGLTTPERIFTSSGTSGQIPSQHYVHDLNLYKKSFLTGFELCYGKPDSYCFLCLLPSYLERKGSSLVYMAETLVQESRHPHSGFFLHDLHAIAEKIHQLKTAGQKTILLGVTYALLDLADYGVELNDSIIVMETGGMKGKREEWPKQRVHEYLKEKFKIKTIHSEYGMTEMLSQAYSTGGGFYACPPWLNIMIRDPYSPGEFMPYNKTGGINVIDLANYYSCSFIATQDAGRKKNKNEFEVLGRLNDAELRGCNLMLD